VIGVFELKIILNKHKPSSVANSLHHIDERDVFDQWKILIFLSNFMKLKIVPYFNFKMGSLINDDAGITIWTNLES
jgi:hypothetical protein